MSKFIIGIDPGKNGGIVALSGTGKNALRMVDITAMPATTNALWDYFIYLGFPNLVNKEDTYVFIEKVHSMPTDGRRAAYSFGYGNGRLDAVVDRLVHNAGVRVTLVSPMDWQRYLGLARAKEKSKYDYKKELLAFAKGGPQTGKDQECDETKSKRVGNSKPRNGRYDNGKGLRDNKQKVACIKWPSKASRSKLTLKTCDAFLIALYGYQQIMEES